ncbi:hypothetical protein PACTADRAFT_47575 [Pachysolen tannophilus NRRL Y-2460]|uniref:Kinetochore protein SPC25 n=1 Tax=Pachysolen tannophilus NRRL Y-2460 TaxID=669874 RepID=A0A1E4U152_PACTA|nr:hypothetical protein PACTADRAFT_47575 [Pachysolen tannophilus NRRL Y-2460]
MSSAAANENGHVSGSFGRDYSISALDEFNSDLKTQMNSFLSLFNKKINDSKNELVSNNYIMIINDLKQQQQDLLKQIDTLTKVKEELEFENASELKELENLSKKNLELSNQQALYDNKKMELEDSINKLNESILNKEETIKALDSKLAKNRKLDVTELTKFETYLGLKIDALREDLLKFTFRNIDLNDYNKEYSFQLDLANENYKIVQTSPVINETDLAKIENHFNTHRELGKFLREIRSYFRSL